MFKIFAVFLLLSLPCFFNEVQCRKTKPPKQTMKQDKSREFGVDNSTDADSDFDISQKYRSGPASPSGLEGTKWFLVESSSSFSQTCHNGDCKTCINDKCFNSSFVTSIMQRANCPTAACGSECYEFVVYNKDNCPICRCDGYATRELCNAKSDCPADASLGCQENLCRYPALPQDLPKACDFSNECNETDVCLEGKCLPGNNTRHLMGYTCVFPYQCPQNYTCKAMTCWEGATRLHVAGRSCIFDFNCPTGFRCIGMTCFEDRNSLHEEFACIFDSQCHKGQRCIAMTCRDAGNVTAVERLWRWK